MTTRDTNDRRVPEPRPTPVLSADFRHMFEAEFGYVCRALRRLGVQEADLKDIAQELFVVVHGQFGQYDRSRPLRPWLFSFALRYAANYRRLARNRVKLSEGEPVTHAGGSALEARDLVLRALEMMDFDRRTVVVMHDIEGFDAPEIAAQTGVPLNTVYSRLRLARVDFREAVDTLLARGGAS